MGEEIKFTHVDGEYKGKINLYALSTCGWCKKTKELLEDMGIDYYYIDVDKLEREAQKNIIESLKKYTSSIGFPILICDDKEVIKGYQKNRIEELLS